MINPLDIPKTLVGTGARFASSVVSTAAKPAGAIVGRVRGSGDDDVTSATAQPAAPAATKPRPAPRRKSATTRTRKAPAVTPPAAPRVGAAAATAGSGGTEPAWRTPAQAATPPQTATPVTGATTPSTTNEPERTPAELAATREGRQPAPFGSHEPESGS
jgi:hypothetical protein